MRLRWIAGVVSVALATAASAQTAVQQSGPTTNGHIPMYVGGGQAQTVVKDGGGSNGGPISANPGEIGITSSGPTYPSASSGRGPDAEHFCMYDAPITNQSGYHYLCLDPNAQGGGLLTYGHGGLASPLPFDVIVNGIVTKPFASLADLPFCTNSDLAPVVAGQPFQCAGLVLIAQ